MKITTQTHYNEMKIGYAKRMVEKAQTQLENGKVAAAQKTLKAGIDAMNQVTDGKSGIEVANALRKLYRSTL